MKKILYIEDNQDTAEAVMMMLKHVGYDAEIASCGKEGLKKNLGEYELFLLDIMLPDMSGWDIFEKLKSKGLNARYAFLSAIPISSERMTELKANGISDYITKPFSKEELISRVNKILGSDH